MNPDASEDEDGHLDEDAREQVDERSDPVRDAGSGGSGAGDNRRDWGTRQFARTLGGRRTSEATPCGTEAAVGAERGRTSDTGRHDSGVQVADQAYQSGGKR